MLFHITQTHSHVNCFAHEPDKRAIFAKALKGGEEIGVKVLASYSDTPGHRSFLIVETDSVDKLQKFIDPMLELWDSEIHPVTDTLSVLKRLQEPNKG
jgi:hypothetical protein